MARSWMCGSSVVCGDRLERLRALKAEHDPDNFFHLNNNIAPAASR